MACNRKLIQRNDFDFPKNMTMIRVFTADKPVDYGVIFERGHARQYDNGFASIWDHGSEIFIGELNRIAIL